MRESGACRRTHHAQGRRFNVLAPRLRSRGGAPPPELFEDILQARPVSIDFTPREREIAQLLVMARAASRSARNWG
jgi:hypothetical protein